MCIGLAGPSHPKDYLYGNGHHTNFNNVEIPHLFIKGKNLNLLEAFQIMKHSVDMIYSLNSEAEKFMLRRREGDREVRSFNKTQH